MQEKAEFERQMMIEEREEKKKATMDTKKSNLSSELSGRSLKSCNFEKKVYDD